MSEKAFAVQVHEMRKKFKPTAELLVQSCMNSVEKLNNCTLCVKGFFSKK